LIEGGDVGVFGFLGGDDLALREVGAEEGGLFLYLSVGDINGVVGEGAV
jgi:hypothetical protein